MALYFFRWGRTGLLGGGQLNKMNALELKFVCSLFVETSALPLISFLWKLY
jgi:hypothetical protein